MKHEIAVGLLAWSITTGMGSVFVYTIRSDFEIPLCYWKSLLIVCIFTLPFSIGISLLNP